MIILTLQDVLKAGDKKDKGLLLKGMVITRLQQRVMLHLQVVQDKIKKIVQTILMLLDVSLQKKAMFHLLLKGMVITRLHQRVMLHRQVVQDKKDRGLLLKVAEMNLLLVILNLLQVKNHLLKMVGMNRLQVRNHLLKMVEMNLLLVILNLLLVILNLLQVKNHLLDRLLVDRLLVDRLLVDLKAYS